MCFTNQNHGIRHNSEELHLIITGSINATPCKVGLKAGETITSTTEICIPVTTTRKNQEKHPTTETYEYAIPEPKKQNKKWKNKNSPVEESLPAEHSRELLGHALPDLLDGSRVANESRRHLQALRRHVAD